VGGSFCLCFFFGLRFLFSDMGGKRGRLVELPGDNLQYYG
jgi:hypothetical protein